MTQKAKRKLTEFNFESSGSHVALVHKDQGGPANLHTTLLTKSTNGITDNQVTQQLELIEKAKFYSQVRSELNKLIQEQYDSDWTYIEDFNESEIIFWKEDSLYSTTYSTSRNGEYILGETASEVSREFYYTPTGKIELSEDAEDKLEYGVYTLVAKSLNNPEAIGRVNKALTIYKQKKEKMQEEIQKAVAAKDAEIAKLQADMASLQEIVKAAETAKKEALLKARETEVSAVLKEGAVELVKSTAELSDEAFAQIVKALGVQKAAVEQSDLMTQQSNPDAGNAQPVNVTEQIIKARYAQKQ